MDSDELECTQVLQESFEEKKTDTLKSQVGYLHVDGEQFPVYNGDTTIGRDPKQCSIFLNKKSVSSHHALIEVESGHHLICDLGSSNSTRLNGLLLKPHVRYNLTDGSVIQIADIRGTYRIRSEKVNEFDTSNQDMFEDSPTRNAVQHSVHSTSLNFSGDCSIIGSTPMKPVFKQPHARKCLNTPGKKADILNKSEPNKSTLKASKQVHDETANREDTLLEDSLDTSTTIVKKMVSFVVPCSQQEASDTNLQLKYDSDQSVETSFTKNLKSPSQDSADKNSTTSKNVCNHLQNSNDAVTVELQADSLSVDLNDSAATVEDLYGDVIEQNLHQIEKKINEEELAEIERTLSSEVLEDLQSDALVEMQSKGTHQLSTQNKFSSKVKIEPNSSTTMKDTIERDIHGVETQCIEIAASDSKVKQRNQCHIMEPGDQEEKSEDIHDAKTQAVHFSVTASDSETDDEAVYGACTEAPSKISKQVDDIHNAKTQAIEALSHDSETDEGMHEACTEKYPVDAKKLGEIREKTLEDIDDVKTQQVIQNMSDPKGSEETENSENFQNAKTHHTEASGEALHEAETVVPENEENGKLDDIHDAKTQAVHVVAPASDSETDDETVYGACTEAPTKASGGIEDIHNATTQALEAVSHYSKAKSEGVSIPSPGKEHSDSVNADDIHSAMTQVIKPSEKVGNLKGKQERSLGESPNSADQEVSENIHDAKTQHMGVDVSDSETDDEGVYQAGSVMQPNEENGKSVDIQEAKTQAVHFDAPASDSETDDETVYGACTEAPTKASGGIEDIHNATTQAVEAVSLFSKARNEGVSIPSPGKEHSDNVNADDIHSAMTQVIKPSEKVGNLKGKQERSLGESPNSADQEVSENIHDAKTQHMGVDVSDSETDDEGVYQAGSVMQPNEENGKSVDIHEAKTQAVFFVAPASDSETDDETVYGACSEAPTKVSGRIEDIHNATTQAVETAPHHTEGSDETMYGAHTEKVGSDSVDIHCVMTQVVDVSKEVNQRAGPSNLKSNEGRCVREIHNGTAQRVVNIDHRSGKPSQPSSELTELSDNIHDAKTQYVEGYVSNSETDDEVLYEAGTEVSKCEENGNLNDIHDAKTQSVHLTSSAVDSNKDKTVYGASTETPCKSICHVQVVHNLKAQAEAVDLTETNIIERGVEDVHDAETQITNINASDSETDDEAVYGACTKLPKMEASEQQVSCTDAGNVQIESTQKFGIGAPNAENLQEQAVLSKVLQPHSGIGEDLNAVKSLNPSPRKRLSLAGGKKNCGINSSALSLDSSQKTLPKSPDHQQNIVPAEHPRELHCSSTEESEFVVSDDIFCASTQVLPSTDPSKVTKMLKDTPVSGAPKSCETAVVGSADLNTPAPPILQDPCSNNSVISEPEPAEVPPIILKPSSSRRGRASKSKTVGSTLSSSLSNFCSESSAKHGKVNSDKSGALSTMNQDSSNLMTHTRKTRRTRKENVKVSKTCTPPRPISPVKKTVSQRAKEMDEDIFCAATQLLPSSQKDDVFSAATQILPSFLNETSVVSPNKSRSSHKRKSVSLSVDVGKGTEDSSLQIQDQNYSNSRKRRSSQPQATKQKKMLGSLSLEVEIEETSSDSSKSVDHTIEGSPELAKLNEKSESSAKKSRKSFEECNSIKPVGTLPPDTSTLTSRSSGKKTLSLSRSRNQPPRASDQSNVNELMIPALPPDISSTDSIEKDNKNSVLKLSTESPFSNIKAEKEKETKRQSLRSNERMKASTCTDSNQGSKNTPMEDEVEVSCDESGILMKPSNCASESSIPNSSLMLVRSSRRCTRESLKVLGKYPGLLNDEETESLKISDSSEDGEKKCTENNAQSEKVVKLSRSTRNTRKGKHTSQPITNTMKIHSVDPTSSGSRRTTRGKELSIDCGVQDEKNITCVQGEKKVLVVNRSQSPPIVGEPQCNVSFSSKTRRTLSADKADVCEESSASAKLPEYEKKVTRNHKLSTALEQSDTVTLSESLDQKDRVMSAVKLQKSDPTPIFTPNEKSVQNEPSENERRSSKRFTRASRQRDASQASISSQESYSSEMEHKNSSRLRKRAFSDSSNDSTVSESRITRSSQPNAQLPESRECLGRRVKQVVNISSMEADTVPPNSDALKFAAPAVKGKRAARSTKHLSTPNEIVDAASSAEDMSAKAGESSQTSLSEASGDRRSSRRNKQSVCFKADDSSKTFAKAAVSTRKASQNSSQKHDVEPMEVTVKGIKRLPLHSSADEPEIEAIPAKLPRQSTSDLSVFESSVSSNNGLDNSVLSSSLKRGGARNDSFSSDVGHESKCRRGRLDSVASTSSSPRRSPRQSLKGSLSCGSVSALFSVYNNPRHENVVKQLGGHVVDNVDAADVLVTDKLRRTVKLLSMVGRGQPIASPGWITLSQKSGRLLDPWDHLLKDKEGELKFGVNLEESLHRASKTKLLEGYSVLVTKNVKPEPEEMKAIIMSCGGQVLTRTPTVWPAHCVLISCNEDKTIWSKLKGKATVVSAEWLLSGVLRQELNTEANLLKLN